jgi:hypothetical protein
MNCNAVEPFRTDNLPGTELPDQVRDITRNAGGRKPDFKDSCIIPLNTDKPEPEAA